jgi:rubrerythrin
MSARDAAVVALGEAVKFESDGRDFYLRAAAEVRNPLAKAVFEALAEDEKEHVRRVREIYEELKDKPGWPTTTAMVARHSGVIDAFEKAALNLKEEVPADTTAEQALQTALDMEAKGLAFYRERLAKASCDAEAEFFKTLLAEEEVHRRAIEKVMKTMD